MKITHRGPNGAEMTYDVPVVQIKDYTVETIFEKKLFILLPFYLFRFADRFKDIDRDEKKIERIKLVLEDIDKRLTQLLEAGEIGAYQKLELLDLMQRVSAKLTQNFRRIRKGVEDAMSVAIIRTKADEVFEQGIERGIEQGEKRGIQKATKLMNFLLTHGRNDDAIRATSDEDYLNKLLNDFNSGL